MSFRASKTDSLVKGGHVARLAMVSTDFYIKLKMINLDSSVLKNP